RLSAGQPLREQTAALFLLLIQRLSAEEPLREEPLREEPLRKVFAAFCRKPLRSPDETHPAHRAAGMASSPPTRPGILSRIRRRPLDDHPRTPRHRLAR